MITTVYTCDRCGKGRPDNNEMWWVRIQVQHAESCNPSFSYPSRVEGKLWCRACCDEHQLIVRSTAPPTTPEQPVPTFEDKIRELIQEELAAARKRER